MEVKLPNKIKIAGVMVTIKYEDKLLENHGKYGQSRFTEGEIVLQKRDMADDYKGQVLCHELLHFLDRMYNNYSLEEGEVDALATGLHALLVDMGVEFDWSEIK